jgi:hypothetical protein
VIGIQCQFCFGTGAGGRKEELAREMDARRGMGLFAHGRH